MAAGAGNALLSANHSVRPSASRGPGGLYAEASRGLGVAARSGGGAIKMTRQGATRTSGNFLAAAVSSLDLSKRRTSVASGRRGVLDVQSGPGADELASNKKNGGR